MWIGLLIGITFVLDQLSKYYVKDTMELGQSIPVISDFVRMTYIENPGIAFGIRIGNGMLFTILSVLVSVGICVYLFTHRNEPKTIRLSLSIVLGGAFGNLADRILFGHVVDFVDVGIGSMRWPVFNVADAAVVIGMVILFLHLFIIDVKKKEEVQEA